MAQILVVEADKVSQAFAYSILRKLGHHAIIARDVGIAWSRLQDNPDIALVAADLAVIQADEMRLVARIRSWENTRTLPVIALCEMLGAKTIAGLMDAGITEVLKKPLQAKETQEALERLLRGPGTSSFKRRHPLVK